jgi:CheY-like chemotaxis protein
MLNDRPLGIFSVTFVKKDSAVTQVLQNFIAFAGGTYTRTENQEQAIAALKAMKPRQLVIFDHDLVRTQMPTLLPLLSRTQFNANQVIFLIKTTATSEDLALLGRAGIRNLLFKPVKPLQLYENLEVGLSLSSETAKITVPEKLNEVRQAMANAQPLKILVVDDSHDNLTLMSLYLESTPHKVSYADNGKLALQKFKEDRFDLVLMDLQMPDIDGYSATASIREWEHSMGLTKVPVIALSAHELNHSPERFKSAGLTLQLVKPIDAQTLLRTISETVATQNQIESDTTSRIKSLEKKIAGLAPAYLEKRKQEVSDMLRYVEERDFKALQMIGHRLKGNAKTYNFGELSEIGASLEKAAENQDLIEVKNWVARAQIFVATASTQTG